MLADRIGGIISIIFGSISMSEAIRLYPARMDTFVGDHTMPGIVGGALILLGLIMVFFIKGESFKVEFPERVIMKSMFIALGLLFAYWFAIPYLGYVISTLLVSIGLFKVLGFFSLVKSTIYATILSVIFYLLFIFWLGMPFPMGIFNI